MGGTGLRAAKLVDLGLIGHPREECTDDVGLLLAALEVPGVSRVDICPLEISNEDPLEVLPVADAVVWEEFKPCPNMFPHTDGEILNDERVIIHPSGSTGEPKIFEPNTGVCRPGVLGDVGGRSEALWERRYLDTSVKGPRSWTLRARTLIVQPATVLGARFTAPLDGPAEAHVACSYCPSMDVIIMPGLTPVVDDTVSVSVRLEAFAHRWSVWSGRRVR